MALVYIVQTCDKLLRQLQDDEVSMIPWKLKFNTNLVYSILKLS